MKRLLIDKKHIMNHIETQRRLWGEDYDVEQVLGDIEDADVVDVPDTNVVKWIPCSERLPEANQIVMCSIKKEYANHRIVLQRFANEEYWHNGIVEAWMPLPEPYKGEE